VLGWIKRIAVVFWLTVLCPPAFANLVGLNQVVTPDIQPPGLLAINLLGTNGAVGNSRELQLDLGLTPSFEIALFQGFEPDKTEVDAQLGLLKRGPFLLSAGMLGVENRLRPQLFLEGGCNVGKCYLLAGIQKQEQDYLGVFGAVYEVTPEFQLQADYISGSDNFATAGFTIYLSPDLSLGPAIFIANSGPHRLYGYGALTWNVKVW
jgi:hypothetical protein